MTVEEHAVLLVERDRRYEDRFKAQEEAVKSALVAQKELTQAAFAASEKAIVKAEESQTAYNISHNDLIRKMDQQHKDTMPRQEAVVEIRRLDEKIEFLNKEMAKIKELLSAGAGEKTGKLSQIQLIVFMSVLLTAAIGVGGVIVAIALKIGK